MAAAPTYPVATIAKLLMISERRVQQLAQEGAIPKAERGRYELAPTVQGYIRYLQERSVHSDATIDYAVEKARLTKAQADLAELTLARERRDVVSVALLEKNLSGLFAEVATNLRNIPGRIVSALVGQTDERAIRRLVLAEIDQVLQALSERDVMIEPVDEQDLSEGGAHGEL